MNETRHTKLISRITLVVSVLSILTGIALGIAITRPSPVEAAIAICFTGFLSILGLALWWRYMRLPLLRALEPLDRWAQGFKRRR